MYLYVELWKSKESWKQLSPEKRQEYIGELLAAARDAPVTGVIPVSVKLVGDVVLLEGTTETPAVIDPAAARNPGYRYVSAWLVPTVELVKKFERRTDRLDWWFRYFDQINAWGEMDPKQVMGDMLGGPIPFDLAGGGSDPHPGGEAPPAGRGRPGDEARPAPDPHEGSRAGEVLPTGNSPRGELSWCPPGRFRMGAEGVPVQLTRGFWIGRYPVTQEQYRQVMEQNPSSFRGTGSPVESLGRKEADAFCRRLTEAERSAGRLPPGWRFDLPTEAQWEYACRAGTTTAYWWGDDPAGADPNAWYSANSGERTRPVGQKRPNPWGIHDILGNVLEYCRDVWREDLPGGTDPLVRAEDLPRRPRRSEEPWQVSRGGGWFFDPSGLRVDFRNRLGARDQSYLIGFRIALVADGGADSGSGTAGEGHGAAAGTGAAAAPAGSAPRSSGEGADGGSGSASGDGPPEGLPDLNTGKLSFQEVQRLVDRAAWIHTYVEPAGAPETLTAPEIGPIGLEADLSLHRFDVRVHEPSGGRLQASNTLGEAAGRVRLRLLAMPDDFEAHPHRPPPPTRWQPDRPQRFVLQEASFRFGDGRDGFTSFATGRTFPDLAGDGGTVVAAIGLMQKSSGRLGGLPGIWVLSGTLDPEEGLRGSVLIRMVDPHGVLTAAGPLPSLRRREMPERDVTYLVIRSRKSGPEQRTTYDLTEDGEVRGLEVPQTLYLAEADFAAAAPGLRVRFQAGATVGEELALVTVNPLQPQPATNEAPGRFQGVGEYVIHDGRQQEVGRFTAQFLDGRSVDMELEGAPGQPASRFGFFGPLVRGSGCFEGAEGLLLGSTGVGIAPHVLSNLYVLRLHDPEGRFRHA